MPLEHEFQVFQRELPNLLCTTRGQFALIHGDVIDSTWKTEDEAYTVGCDRFGLEPFLVMLIEENEKPTPLPFDVPPYADNPRTVGS